MVNGAPVVPDNSIVTMAQVKAKEVAPDCAITIFHLVRCYISATPLIFPVLFLVMFNSWHNIKVRQRKIPIIAILKCPAMHHMKSREHFGEALEVQMGFAQADLLKQVEHAFLMQPTAKKIVLLACCGELWSWMVAMRAAHLEKVILLNFVDPENAKKLEINNTPHEVPESRAQEHLPCDKKAIK